MKAKIKLGNIKIHTGHTGTITRDYDKIIEILNNDIKELKERAKRPWIVNAIKDFLERYASHKRAT